MWHFAEKDLLENWVLPYFQQFAAFLKQSCAPSIENSLQTHNKI